MDGPADPNLTAGTATTATTLATPLGATITTLDGDPHLVSTALLAPGAAAAAPGAAPAAGASAAHPALQAASHGLGGAGALPPSVRGAPALNWTLDGQDASASAGAAAAGALGPFPSARGAVRGAEAGMPPPAKSGRSTAATPTPSAGDALVAADQFSAATALASTAVATTSDADSPAGSVTATSTDAASTATAPGDGGALADASLFGPALDAAAAHPRLEAGASATPLQNPPANPMEKAVANQVSRSLVQNLPGGDRLLVVRLTPPELGTVRVEVVEHQGTLTAHLHAEDDGVRLAIEHYLPTMRAELRAHDAPIREISLTDQSSGRSFADGQQQPQNRQQPAPTRGSGGGERFAISASAAAAATGAGAAALGGTIDATSVDWRA